jgi:hypothetical protein
MEDVQKDVAQQLMGTHCDAIKKVVIWLHGPPCPNTNPAVSSMSVPEIVDTFWNEFNAFKNCTQPNNVPSRWASANIIKGYSYLWHEKYSIPYMSVLGFVACCVTSKLCGIGPAKRSWGRVKQVKDGIRSHLSGKLTEKRSILFVFLEISQAQIKCEHMENLDATRYTAMFGDNDINFDLELESFGVEMGPLREPAV